MMNWKDFLNYSMLSTRHIIKIIFLVIFLAAAAKAQQDSSVTRSQTDTVFTMSKSPWGAVLRSAVIPGLGQIYNQSYIKTGIIWGIGAWLVYNWINNDNDYKYYQKLYESENITIYRQYRNLYRDQRDLFSIYMVLTYVLNLVDAYVDAQLFDFSVKEDFYTGSPMLNLKIKLF